jgi:hypothetical protein
VCPGPPFNPIWVVCCGVCGRHVSLVCPHSKIGTPALQRVGPLPPEDAENPCFKFPPPSIVSPVFLLTTRCTAGCGPGMWASKQRLHWCQRHGNAETTLIKASWPTTLSVQVQVQALPVSQSASARSRGGEPIPARYQDRLIGRCHPSSNSEPEIVNSPAVCQLTVLLSLAGLAESRRWSTARSQDPESARDTGSPAA